MDEKIEASVDRLSFMLSVPDLARADIAMTPEKTYYRFMTEDSLEDGELPGLKEDFETLVNRALSGFKAGVGVSSPTDPVKLNLFINNRKVEPEILNNSTLAGFIDVMKCAYAEFAFLGGFR